MPTLLSHPIVLPRVKHTPFHPSPLSRCPPLPSHKPTSDTMAPLRFPSYPPHTNPPNTLFHDPAPTPSTTFYAPSHPSTTPADADTSTRPISTHSQRSFDGLIDSLDSSRRSAYFRPGPVVEAAEAPSSDEINPDAESESDEEEEDWHAHLTPSNRYLYAHLGPATPNSPIYHAAVGKIHQVPPLPSPAHPYLTPAVSPPPPHPLPPPRPNHNRPPAPSPAHPTHPAHPPLDPARRRPQPAERRVGPAARAPRAGGRAGAAGRAGCARSRTVPPLFLVLSLRPGFSSSSSLPHHSYAGRCAGRDAHDGR